MLSVIKKLIWFFASLFIHMLGKLVSILQRVFAKYIGPFSFVNIYVSSIDIKESKSNIDFGLAN